MAFFFTCGTHGMIVPQALHRRSALSHRETDREEVELTLLARSLPITPIALREYHLPMSELRQLLWEDREAMVRSALPFCDQPSSNQSPTNIFLELGNGSHFASFRSYHSPSNPGMKSPATSATDTRTSSSDQTCSI